MADVKQSPENISELSQWKKRRVYADIKKKSQEKIHTKARKQETKQLAVFWYTANVIAATATKCDSTRSETTKEKHTLLIAVLRCFGEAAKSNVGHM